LKRKSAFVGLIAVAACTGAAWTLWPRAESADRGLPGVKVVRRDFASSVLATGAVRPKVGAEVRVGARISGKVMRLHANIGDSVKKGQVIAELEKVDLEAMVAQRRAELAMAQARLSAVRTLGPRRVGKAEADVVKWRATQRLASRELAREEKLLEGQATSQEAADRVRERLSVAQAQLASVVKVLELARGAYTEDLKHGEADIRRAMAGLDIARAQLSYATITAPIKGVIASVSTQEGETVAAGLNAPTFVTLIDLDRLQVDAFVDEVDIGKVKVGQKATFTVDAFPDREFQGRTSAIYPKAVIQENVVNYDVVIDIAGRYEGLLRPEMTANVTIVLEARQNVTAVTARAIQRRQDKSIVYVKTDAGPESREVKVGWRDGQWVEVLDGLSVGQTVLLEPRAGAAERKP
jgi:HlyD family secretion protein